MKNNFTFYFSLRITSPPPVAPMICFTSGYSYICLFRVYSKNLLYVFQFSDFVLVLSFLPHNGINTLFCCHTQAETSPPLPQPPIFHHTLIVVLQASSLPLNHSPPHRPPRMNCISLSVVLSRSHIFMQTYNQPFAGSQTRPFKCQLK